LSNAVPSEWKRPPISVSDNSLIHRVVYLPVLTATIALTWREQRADLSMMCTRPLWMVAARIRHDRLRPTRTP
jgi:hypothetical protein